MRTFLAPQRARYAYAEDLAMASALHARESGRVRPHTSGLWLRLAPEDIQDRPISANQVIRIGRSPSVVGHRGCQDCGNDLVVVHPTPPPSGSAARQPRDYGSQGFDIHSRPEGWVCEIQRPAQTVRCRKAARCCWDGNPVPSRQEFLVSLPRASVSRRALSFALARWCCGTC